MDFYSALKIMHAVGFSLGLGSLVFIDAYAGPRRHRPINRGLIATMETGHRLVSIGLLLLWLSGAGFLLHYYFEAPGKLSNPKIYAKTAIVLMLTFNGIFVGRYVLPLMKKMLGRHLWEFDNRQLFKIAVILGLSAVSWLFAFSFGILRALNYIYPMEQLLALYIAAAAIGINVTTGIIFWFRPVKPSKAKSAPAKPAKGDAAQAKPAMSASSETSQAQPDPDCITNRPKKKRKPVSLSERAARTAQAKPTRAPGEKPKTRPKTETGQAARRRDHVPDTDQKPAELPDEMAAMAALMDAEIEHETRYDGHYDPRQNPCNGAGAGITVLSAARRANGDARDDPHEDSGGAYRPLEIRGDFRDRRVGRGHHRP